MIVSDSSFVLSYDVGGSHISAGLCSLSNLELINIVSAKLTSVATFDAFADLVHSIGLEAADGEPNIAGASLAVPGPFDTLAGSSLMEHKLTVPPGGEIWNYLYADGIVEDLISTRRIKADYFARTGGIAK
jgi:hypothetical protein